MIQFHVDVDNLWVYENEYGLHPSRQYSRMYCEALPRLLDIFGEKNIKATFFLVGADLQYKYSKDFCMEALRQGHEIANHTFSHREDFYKLSPAKREYEIIKGQDMIAQTTGRKPKGFRAPGYYLDRDTIELLIKHNYAYDSSILPSCANILMKPYIEIMSKKRLNKSFGRIRHLFASKEITRCVSLYSHGSLLECPITVSPLFRLPIHSTFIFLCGRSYFKTTFCLLKAFKPQNIVYLFHGLDTFEAKGLAHEQVVPTLRIPLEHRLNILREIIDQLMRIDQVATTESLLSFINPQSIRQFRAI
jgi:peptidoglycan-N-acetylglucosamine deacetylase